MNESIRTYLAAIGAKGGRAGIGKSKARTSAQARKAAKERWRKSLRKRKANRKIIANNLRANSDQ